VLNCSPLESSSWDPHCVECELAVKEEGVTGELACGCPGWNVQKCGGVVVMISGRGGFAVDQFHG
jgi:hypothetical protein